jgi:hypothetical protein
MKKKKLLLISCAIVLFSTRPLTGHNLQMKVNWTPFDFIAIVLLNGSSVLSELILRKNHKILYRTMYFRYYLHLASIRLDRASSLILVLHLGAVKKCN